MGINNRLEFYIACDWMGELDFYYYTRNGIGRSKKDWRFKRKTKIINEAKRKGAFQ